MGSRLNLRQGGRQLVVDELESTLSQIGATARRARREVQVAWYCGTVKPYESLYSVAAKWCIANRLSAEAFVKWADQIAPNLNYAEPGAYWERWSAEALLKALGEPVRLAETVGLRFGITATRSADKSPAGEGEGTKFCQRCLAQGFHSALHGEYILRRCFVHRETLLTVNTIDIAPGLEDFFIRRTRDFSGIVSLLIKLWSGLDAPFPLPRPYLWPRMLLDHGSVKEADVIVSELYESEKNLGIPHVLPSDGQRRRSEPSGSPLPTRQDSPIPRGGVIFEYDFDDDDTTRPTEGTTAAADSTRSQTIDFSLELEDQRAALHGRPVFLLSRAASVIAQNKWPRWRELHHRFSRDLMRQHHSCKVMYESIDGRDLRPWSWLRTERVKGWESVPGRLRLAFFDTPCVRVDSEEVWRDLLSNLAEFFFSSGWRGTSIPPEEIEVTGSGEIERLADELLEAFVRAFAWALLDTEPDVDLTAQRPYVRRKWLERCKRYMPKYCLSQLDGGVRLRIQPRIPAEDPDFVNLSPANQRTHLGDVRCAIAQGSRLFTRRYDAGSES